ncbi:MAG: hypothetical protein V1838_02960 [Patescibacteria group bacterium]
MDIQPFLAASVTNIIIAQRLVRTICPYCKGRKGSVGKVTQQYGKYFALEKVHAKLKKLSLLQANSRLADVIFYQGKGCAKCNSTGYRGRVGLYELLKVDEDLYQTILHDPSAGAIEKVALSKGMLTMAEDGLLKVFQGQTTFDEVLRVIKE